ncbi:hypothetical protein [uncultured Pseudokineococcus sp.]|uniref:hypothetical protein n=1 Tax=uncultured Pseudokineococcus sp. TaxID=1642928 RepID=UPI002611D134|nr:hypothetical protein [uncultured Pseudokineococcus sp.]
MASTSLGRLNRSAADHDTDAPGRSPWRRPGFVVSGVLLAALVVLALVLLLLPPAGEGSTATAPQPSATEPAPQPSSPPTADAEAVPAAGESVCGLEPGDQAIPTSAPQAQWELVGTTAVPEDPDGAGPGVATDDGFRSCFSHDPTGALYAGINWWAQTLNGRAVQVYEELTADTPERDAALEQGLDESAGGIGQIAGYRFVDVDADRALYELAFRTPQGDLVSVTTPMRWEDGDWKLVIPSTGDPSVGALPDLTGFTPWSGVG